MPPIDAGRTAPTDPRRELERGFARLRAGDAAAAARAAQGVLARAPDHHGALNLAGLAALQQGDAETAIARLTRAELLAPGQPIYPANLAAALRAAHRHADAASACRRALALRPGYRAALVTLGAAQFALEDHAGALDSYELALQRAGAEQAAEPDPADGEKALLYAYRGDALRELGRVRAAVAAYEQALALEPERVETQVALADTLREAGDLAAAIERLRGILNEHPGHPPALLALGSALWEDGDAEGAIGACREAVAAQPEDAGARASLAGILASAGDVAAANAANREALTLTVNPGCVPALSNLAQNLRGKLPAADAERMEALLKTRWVTRAAAFPNARIIHCRRDVRDVALSCWMTQFAQIRWAFDLAHLAERILQYQRIMDHWRAVLPLPMLEIDYEETVADQAGQTRRLLDFIGLDWDDACLRFHETERLVRTASVTQVRQPVYQRSVARWRRYEAMLAPLLERIGM